MEPAPGEMKPPSRGARDVATMLPFIAVAFLMPPIILIFARPATLGGVPLIIVYIFGVWAVIVAAAFLISRILRHDEATPAGDDGLVGMDEP